MSPAAPAWIEAPEVLALHDRLLALHGGPAGLRDEGLLTSALGRPRQLAAYGEGADIVRMAAAYTAGIVQNHPLSMGTSGPASSSGCCSWN